MKKIMFVFMLMLLCTVTCTAAPLSYDYSSAKNVAIFMDTPPTAMSWVESEDVINLVTDKAKILFPEPTFKILDLGSCQMAKKVYKEEHPFSQSIVVTNPDGSQSNVSTTEMQSFNTTMMHDVVAPLKLSEAVEVGKELNADYILMLRITNSMPTYSSDFFSVSAKTTVKCDVRVLDVKEAKYIFMKEIAKDGKSTAILSGMPSFKNAYMEAIEKSLSEVQLNTRIL